MAHDEDDDDDNETVQQIILNAVRGGGRVGVADCNESSDNGCHIWNF